MKLNQVITIKGEIFCMSGLCIGGSSNGLEIGGVSQEVIKNPLTKEPYIPGSSLKGKMRSELEKKYGAKRRDKINNSIKYFTDNKQPCGCGKKDCMICVIFGAHGAHKAHISSGVESAPTRIIVRDALPSKEFRMEIEKFYSKHENYLEQKVENIIQRDKGTANSPRTIERVPEGASFDFEIILRVFEGDDAEKMLAFVKEGLELVELSYLGGSGSRGYGKVRFDYEIHKRSISEEGKK